MRLMQYYIMDGMLVREKWYPGRAKTFAWLCFFSDGEKMKICIAKNPEKSGNKIAAKNGKEMYISFAARVKNPYSAKQYFKDYFRDKSIANDWYAIKDMDVAMAISNGDIHFIYPMVFADKAMSEYYKNNKKKTQQSA